ncbi:methyltransferase domain-containing protein [Paenibacillus sp. N3/727]|uniref:methyltransferase n=1 Tax=Paenibacillus sp. N3/727 TaxID=2925845 RepID=UPI001F539D42|nr:methyltransferase [Paenibacillus sp. N3/727]UNK18018.1 methyltransferase domain-containing protein [Paenibacillus sp. N3/727]
MARLNLDYYESSTDEVYSDGDIEYELLQYAKQDEYDWFNDGRWPVVYHMSHLRHNILNWYPFKENSTILEIGAGCGALTGLFCERAAKVVAVELTKRRAEVNFQRHQHYDNLEIVVCDFQSLPSEWKFDYVIINGVLEYASYVVKGENPYVNFLEISAQHLKQHGRLLLTIENRLGLKYFSGSKEDHTGRYFSGINGYVEEEKVRTFSKEELTEQISKAKLHVIKFYYPYPDYKFPAEIFTDTTVCNMLPTVSDYPLDIARTRFFEERNVYKSFVSLGVMDKFSNSFMVEISKNSEETPADISYVKLSANRNERFRIFTYIDSDRKNVYKKFLNPLGRKHLANMQGYSDYKYVHRSIKNTVGQVCEGGLSFPYISGKSLEEVLLTAISLGDIEGFITQVKRFRDNLYQGINLQGQQISNEFRKIFGDVEIQQDLRWINDTNIDLISGNIFIIGDSYQVIDYEWHFPIKIPQEFVMWRMLKQLMNDHNLSGFLTKSLFYELLDISEKTEQCFSEWEVYFSKEYVGIRDLHSLSKDIIPIDIEKAAVQQMKENVLQSTLFYDMGNGFQDTNYERCKVVSTESGFTVTFSKKDLNLAEKLRWDPLEGMASCIQIEKIETDGTIDEIIPLNAEKYVEDKGYEFFTFDPQFELRGDFTKASYLSVIFSCIVLDWTQGYQKREEEMNQYRLKLEEQCIKNQSVETELNDFKNLYSSAQAQFNEKLAQLSAVQTELIATKEHLNSILNELNRKENDLNYILTQMNEHRIKTVVKVLMKGCITRGAADE